MICLALIHKRGYIAFGKMRRCPGFFSLWVMGIVKLTRLRPFSVRDICEYFFDLVATIFCLEFGHIGI